MVKPFELTLWKSFRELTTLRDEMDKLWNCFIEEWSSHVSVRGDWTPMLDSFMPRNSSLFLIVPGLL